MSKDKKFPRINGLVPVVPTPFEADGCIAEADFARLIEFACALEVSALCLPAYASEFYKLAEEERQVLVANAIKLSRGRKPVIAQALKASPS